MATASSSSSFSSTATLLCFFFLFSLQALAQHALGQNNPPWPYLSFTTKPDIRPPKMEVTKKGEPTAPGYLFVGPRGNEEEGTAPLIYDEEGNLIYQGPHGVVSNFRVQKIDGKDMLTFWSGDMLPLGHGYGTFHALDETYQEVYTIRLTGNYVTAYDDDRESYIDLHETTVTKDDTLLVTCYNVTRADLTDIGGTVDAWALDAQFYEIDIKTNEILFSWSAFEHAEWDFPISKQPIYEKSLTQDEPYDSYHINSVEKVKDGYIISMRHVWGGFYVNRDGTMRWYLDGADGGDFLQGEGTDYSWQHDLRVFNETDEGLILNLFNNANTPKSQIEPTSGLSVHLDLVNMKVTKVKRLIDEEDPIFAVSQGNYQQLENSDHVVIDYGSITVIKEFDGAGNAIMTARYGPNDIYAGYRGFKCEWAGIPFWDPDVVITPIRNNKAELHMSWNGATEYDNWAIFGGQARDPIGSSIHSVVERTGFETTTVIDTTNMNYIQIAARMGDTVMRTSEIFMV